MCLFRIQEEWEKKQEQDRRRQKNLRSESWRSLLFGVPSIVTGTAAMVLLLLIGQGRLIGPEGLFYNLNQSIIQGARNYGENANSLREGQQVVPSSVLDAMLIGGLCLGWIGIRFSRRRAPDRRVTVSAVGMFICAMTLGVVYFPKGIQDPISTGSSPIVRSEVDSLWTPNIDGQKNNDSGIGNSEAWNVLRRSY